MDKRSKLLKPPRKGKSKKEQKMGKWRDKGERGCPGPTRGDITMYDLRNPKVLFWPYLASLWH